MDLSDQCANLFAEIEPVQETLYMYMKNGITSANLSDEKSLRETTGIFPDSKLISWPKVGPFVTPRTWIFSGGKRGGGEIPQPIKSEIHCRMVAYCVGGGVFYPVLDGRESFLYLNNVCYEKLCLFFVPAQKNTSPWVL
jgi:hypothetical protein